VKHTATTQRADRCQITTRRRWADNYGMGRRIRWYEWLLLLLGIVLIAFAAQGLDSDLPR